MTRLIRRASWLAVAGVAIVSLYYFIDHASSASFLDEAMGNLISTIVGVVFGVPVALEIARRQQAEADASAEQKHEAERVARQTRVLTLLRSELRHSSGAITERRHPISAGQARAVMTEPLRSDLWGVFADSGELSYVDNPDLLAAIADAYHHINTLVRLEGEFLTVSHFPGLRVAQERPPEVRLLGYLAESDGPALVAIDAAVSAIDLLLTKEVPQ